MFHLICVLCPLLVAGVALQCVGSFTQQTSPWVTSNCMHMGLERCKPLARRRCADSKLHFTASGPNAVKLKRAKGLNSKGKSCLCFLPSPPFPSLSLPSPPLPSTLFFFSLSSSFLMFLSSSPSYLPPPLLILFCSKGPKVLRVITPLRCVLPTSIIKMSFFN